MGRGLNDKSALEVKQDTLLGPEIQGRLDKFFITSSCIIAIWSFASWYSLMWEYMPDWLPLPGLPDFVACFSPLLFLIFLIPALLIFIFCLLGNLILFIDRILSFNIPKVFRLAGGLIILGSSALPWMLLKDVEKRALDYGIERYDVVIEAIETYRSVHGHYPANLNVLVPEYLPELPGVYMKFGKTLTYEPDPSLKYDHAPFVFELYGQYQGTHGQILKYCPITVEPCFEKQDSLTPSRINARWIWVYSSAL